MNHEWDIANHPSDGILEAVELLQCHTYLSPHTPFVQGSNGDDRESQLPVGYYPSPEFAASVSPPYMKYWSSIDSLRNTMFIEARETSTPISYGQAVEMTSCQSGPPFPPFSPDSDNSRGHGT